MRQLWQLTRGGLWVPPPMNWDMPTGVVAHRRALKPMGPAAVEFLRDLFTGTAGTHLESHSPDIGGAWSQINFGLGMLEADLDGSGKAVQIIEAATKTCGYGNATTAPSSDYKAYCTIRAGTIASGNDCYIFARINGTDLSTGYSFGFRAASTRWELRVGSGILASQSVTISTADVKTIEIRVVGSAISGWVDGAQVLSVTDTQFATAGKVCLYLGGTGVGSGGWTGHAVSDLHAVTIV